MIRVLPLGVVADLGVHVLAVAVAHGSRRPLKLLILFVTSLALVLGVLLGVGGPTIARDAAEARAVHS